MSLRRRLVAFVGVLALVGISSACGDDEAAAPTTTSTTTTTTVGTSEARPGIPAAALEFTVLDRRPHDTASFTEGFTFTDDGRLIESLGLDGQSSVREVDPTTGAAVREAKLPADQFGEGLALGPDGLVQLTWKNGIAHRWDPSTFAPEGTFTYDNEGWGLTYDGTNFVQSDGSPTLTVRDAATFEPVRTIEVRRDGVPVDELNELEWVDGVIWANVWHSDDILRIDPSSGDVTGVVDASSLWRDPSRDAEMTLNGIAHRPGDPAGRLWVTGKNWPEMFELEVAS